MRFQIPISENYPHFLWRAIQHPRKLWKGIRPSKSMPGNIWIEITNRCNLRCRSCYKLYGHHDSTTDMDLDLFERIVQEVAPHAQSLNLTGSGEFLYHKRIESIFQCLMQWPHVPLWFTTNGVLMTADWVRRLAQRRTEVIFSIDGTDQETHEFNRPGGDLEKIVRAMRLARELELSSSDPAAFPFKRHINFLVMRNNMRQMPAIVDWAKDFGVSSLRFTMMNNWGCPESFWREQNPLNYRDELVECLNQARAAASENGVFVIAPEVSPRRPPVTSGEAAKTGQPRGLLRLFKPSPATAQGFPRFEDRYCHRPFDSVYIGADGTASVCCAACYVQLGHARKQTIRQIWEGWAFRRLRAGMLLGSHTLYCRVCDLPYGLARGNPRDAIIE